MASAKNRGPPLKTMPGDFYRNCNSSFEKLLEWSLDRLEA